MIKIKFNTQSILEFGRPFMVTVTLAACLGLSACGNSKKVQTEDDSADYQSATSLPPLKKPSRVLSPNAIRTNDSPAPVQAEPMPLPVSQSEAPLANSSPDNAGSTIARQAPQTENLDSVTARVIQPSDKVSRLKIDAKFDRAWAYLTNNLQQSDVTVYSRNESAGRFSIGCAEIEAAPVVEKRGGWSLLRKKNAEQLEYCALQAVSSKGSTVVTVLNRAGQEVGGEYAALVFGRILNN